MAIVVRPRARSSSACWTARSVSLSSARGGLVENQHGRVAKHGAGDRHALLLAAGEAVAALADGRVVALGQRGDELVDLGGLGGLLRSRRRSPRGRRSGGSRGSRRGRGRSPGRPSRRSAASERGSCRECRRRRSRRARAGAHTGARRDRRGWSCRSRSRRRARFASGGDLGGRSLRASRRLGAVAKPDVAQRDIAADAGERAGVRGARRCRRAGRDTRRCARRGRARSALRGRRRAAAASGTAGASAAS